ncbi:MAG: hypothetical protein ACKVOR_09940 [Flavobacteriales bacterium]
MKRPYLLILLLLISTTSCDQLRNGNKDKVKWQVVEADGFRIRLPNYMTSLGEDFSPDATIGYGNNLKEIYAQVIVERKDEVDAYFANYEDGAFANGLAGYADFVMDNYRNALEKTDRYSGQRTENIGPLLCKLFDLSGDMITDQPFKGSKVKIYHAVNVVEGRAHYYQFSTWTLDKFRNKYQDLMNKILMSIEEVDGPTDTTTTAY